MRCVSLLAIVLLAGCVTIASAGQLNRNYLAPVYDACPGSGNCNPPTRTSSYTFDTIIMQSSAQQFTGPGKLALAVTVKGLKDATGAPATGTLQLRVPTGRTTIIGVVGTIGETSPLLSETVYDVPVKNGVGRGRFTTPDVTPEHGLVVNSFGSPVLYDPEGKALASTGTQSKP
jgi:hypothetical protein